MKQSGTKLVVGLAGLALAAGLASWSYQYEATHQSTRFWGRKASSLIARPSEVEFFRLELADAGADAGEDSSLKLDLGRPYLGRQTRKLTKERGMVHFRHALMTDGNYEWSSQPEPSEINWRWCLRFHDEQFQALVVLAEDLATIGLVEEGSSPPVRTLACQPMAETLRDYFQGVGLTTASTAK